MVKVLGRPRIEGSVNRPLCPTCRANEEVVSSGYRHTKFGKEHVWFCKSCGKPWTEEGYIRSLVSKAIKIAGNDTKEASEEGYLKLLKEIAKSSKRKGFFTGEESEIHSKMKQVVLAALLASGLEKVTTEYTLRLVRRYTLDVAGIDSGKLVAVECGDINSSKQADFWEFFSDDAKAELYWFPYNAGIILRVKPAKYMSENFQQFRKQSKSHK